MSVCACGERSDCEERFGQHDWRLVSGCGRRYDELEEWRRCERRCERREKVCLPNKRATTDMQLPYPLYTLLQRTFLSPPSL